jgi:DNA-binding CsgD family transcriptional regulator
MLARPGTAAVPVASCQGVTSGLDTLVGRESELDALGAYVDSDQLPTVVVVEGEAGIGKTSLCVLALDAARDRGFASLAAHPLVAETDLALGGLGDLLEPVLADVLDSLPMPQARALRVALLLEESSGPADARALGMAFLSALRLLAEERPLLLFVDDVQWLDVSSAAVLAYAARRLREDPVAVLLARRAGHSDAVTIALHDVRRLELGGLSLGALHRLLRERLGLVLSGPVLRRVHEASRGNPFYALEIARTLEAGAAELSASAPLPIPPKLEELTRNRIAGLPSTTRRALVFAACLASPRLSVISKALGMDPERALRPAVEAEVVFLEDDRVGFVHPLLAEAVYASTDEAGRRGVHEELAKVVDDPEEHARQLALGAPGPDESVAGALEDAASRASARGAIAAAARLWEEAQRLTPAERDADTHRRTLSAARCWFLAGDIPRARMLLEHALSAARPGVRRAKILAMLGHVAIYEGDQPAAAELLRHALAEAGDDDATRAAAEQSLATVLFFMREDLEAACAHQETAVELAARTGDRSLLANALATRGLIEALLGRREAHATIAQAHKLPSENPRVSETPPYHRAMLALWADGHEEAGRLFGLLAEDAASLGDESSLPVVLAPLAVAEFLCGRWSRALQVAGEAYDVALQAGQRPQQAWALSVRALVRAGSGLEDAVREDANEVLAITGERAMAVARIHAAWALGLLELSLDRPEAAVDILAPLREQLRRGGVAEPGSMRFVPDEIEALVALGRLDEAEAILRWLEEQARGLERASALAAAARCRGLLAAARGDKAGALTHLEQSLDHEEPIRIPFDRARTLLSLGEARRRAKQKAAAREALGQALSMFEELGARLWAEKARTELATIGGRVASPDELTPAERRIAELVAAGRTNKEVASALFLSDRTVEGHLTSIYRKLGVRSRAELARAFS